MGINIFRKKTFKGGIHPEYNKGISIREPLHDLKLPDKIVVPLSQHIGTPNEPLVKKGDYVEEGQIIGKSASFVSSPVHSSIYGTVTGIEKEFHPVLGASLSIAIERDKEKSSKKYVKSGNKISSREDILEKIRLYGLVGMGGAGFHTHVKLSIPKDKSVDILILNGAECEPFLTCDHFLMMRKTKEILRGIEILIDLLQPKETYIAIEDNKQLMFFAFENLMKSTDSQELRDIKISILKTKYPQGGEKELIKAITGREVPPGKIPLEVGCLVQNIGTAYAVYEACDLDKPLIERIITISGDCVKNAGNYLVKVGMTLKDMVDLYGIDFNHDFKKIIFGGPMMGISVPHMNVPILKSTSGVLFLSEKYIKNFEESQCIRCAKCVDACPLNLLPTEFAKHVKKERWADLENLWISDCIECGACSYVCPSRIPIVSYVKEGKSVLRKFKK
ncbi:electron transporter RnfC [Candidatus Omnitrophus magneticus]|uniref:Ion-translocating oxidoreductase complex subunit C n=1 Tax=Candidatus Omnitrophus magneticus TaxID=1609969 RepID=A0A0F0CSB8_9BACT|nr:electron transporter RnfC [Candidatus Omnitrophus magneticus]